MFRRLASMGVSGHRDGRRLPRRSCRYAGRQVPRPSHQPDLAGEGQERERQQVVRSGQRAGLRRCPSCRAPPCLSQTWCQLRRRSHRRRHPKPGRLRHRCRGRRRTWRLRRTLADHWGRNSMEKRDASSSTLRQLLRGCLLVRPERAKTARPIDQQRCRQGR